MRLLLLGGVRVLGFDSFTDTNGTSLSAHKLDTGQSWSVTGTGTLIIQSNQCQSNSGSNSATALADFKQPNVAAEADITIASGGDLGLLVRATDVNNWWLCDLNQGSGQLQIWQDQAGTTVQRAATAATITAGSTYHVKFAAQGQVLTGFLNGSPIVSYTSSFNVAATQCGLLKGGGNSAAAINVDNFKVSIAE